MPDEDFDGLHLDPDELNDVQELEQQAFDENKDIDYETLRLIPIQDPVWDDSPEKDEDSKP